MGYYNEIYKSVYDDYTTHYLVVREEAARRTEELHEKIPALIPIDRELSHVGVEIFGAAMGGGDREAKLTAIREKNLALQKARADLLAAGGYPEDYDAPHYRCPICSDSGFMENKMCSCMRRALTLAVMENSGLAGLLSTQTFDTFSLDFYKENPKYLEIMTHNETYLRRYASSFSPSSKSILMVGQTGLGKTHLSSAVAGVVIEKGYDVFYIGAIDMFSHFENRRFGNGDGGEDATISHILSCDLLILDDLGTEFGNTFSASCLYQVINTRLCGKRPTIVNTNLSRDAMMERYTDRVVSRLFGEYELLLFCGRDVRTQKLK